MEELFTIITGRVHEFVFKHDAVRVIQCAVKYANPAQRKQIATELQGHYRDLAESRYAKFLIAKLVVGDDEIRDMVIPEFYGHVKRLIRLPEASWILDDIYRGIATKEQKARLLREWYGTEFVLFRDDTKQSGEAEADLGKILEAHPEKRGPIMKHLKEMTNQLVQKKTTGFTMLHDALLQYFLNCRPGSPEATEFLEMLRDDEEGDCFKNLAFTKSGARLVCLALAYGSSKDRRTILKFFKTHMKLLAGDLNGHLVLLAAYEVVDDTVMSSKAIFTELLNKDLSKEEREQDLLGQVEHLTARIPLLWLLSPEPPKWLVTAEDSNIVDEVRKIRTETSKKDPEVRRVELVKALSQPLLDLVAAQTQPLIQSSYGCQFVAEVLIGGVGEKQAALESLCTTATDLSEEIRPVLDTAHVGRMLKTLSQGGRFDKETKSIKPIDPPLKFGDLLYERITTEDGTAIVDWASGPNSFVVLSMLEALDFAHKEQLLKQLNKGQKKLKDNQGSNAGSRIILQKIGASTEVEEKPKTEKKPKNESKEKRSKDQSKDKTNKSR